MLINTSSSCDLILDGNIDEEVPTTHIPSIENMILTNSVSYSYA